MRRQSGEVRIGTIFWLLVAIALILISKEAIPVKLKSSQLDDYMIELAKFSTRETPEGLEKRILKRAQELEIPLTKNDVSVSKSNGRIKMRAHYMIPLKFPFYTYRWNFNHVVDRPIFII